MNLSDIIEYHKISKRVAGTVMTVSLIPVNRKSAIRFGVALLEQMNGVKVVRRFIEKPKLESIPADPSINAGVYVMDANFILPALDEFLPKKPNTNLEKTLLERLGRDEEPDMAGYLLDLDAWFDVGTLDQLVDTNVYVASMKGGN